MKHAKSGMGPHWPGWRSCVVALALCVSPAWGRDRVALKFVNADLDTVVRAVGQYTGRTFVIDPRVKGTLTLSTERSLSRAQAMAALTAALRLQGFALVEAGGVMRVVPEADAKFQGGRVGTGQVPPTPDGDQLITQVFRLQYETAANVLPVVRPLVPAGNPVTAHSGGNVLVVTDYAENLRRIEKVIAAIDVPPAPNVEVVPLKHAIATDVAALMSRLNEVTAPATDPLHKVTVLADPLTNSIVVQSGSAERTRQLRSMVAGFDTPSMRSNGVYVVPLRNAEAAVLAKTLSSIRVPDPGAGGVRGPQAGLSGAAGPIAAVDSGGGTTVVSDNASNSLIITGTENAYRTLRGVIDRLDVRRAQVFIECLIVEVSSDQAAEFGIQWLGGLDRISGTGAALAGGTNFGNATQNIVSGARNLGALGPGLNIGIVKGQVTVPGLGAVTNLSALARALESNSKANILSTPNILTLDNEEAKIVVGQNVPFITGQFLNQASAGTTVNPFQTIERRDVGLTLKVKPQISEGGTVRLTLYQEVSSVQDTTSAAGIITNKRSLDTSVVVDDGNIVVLGGLVRDQLDSTVQKVPGLGDIPWLGALFRYDTRRLQKTNLMLFMRPYVIRDESGSRVLTVDRYDYMQKAQQSTTPTSRHFALPTLEGPVVPGLPAPTAARPSAPSDRPAAPPSDAPR
ncbi:MAG: type II secretion system secretin GspD [Betaproteobacteria bacterium]|nr:type II secretion system secretin GspD [Betaproteobacteria bacterium]